MALLTRNRIGLLSSLCLALIFICYLFLKPSIPNENSIREYLTQNLTKWTGAIVTVDGSSRLNYFPRLAMEISDVRLSDITKLPALREIRAKKMNVRLGLWSLISGTPRVDRITLIEPQIKSSTVARATALQSGSDDVPVFMRALASNPFDQFVLEQGVVMVEGPETGEAFTDVNTKITLSAGSGAVSAKGTFKWRDQTLSFRYEGASPSQAAKTVKIPVSLNLQGELVTAAINGEAMVTDSVRVNGNLDLAIQNLPGFARWMGILVPEKHTRGDFSAVGSFHWGGNKIGFDEGTFELDGNKALGALALELSNPRPQIEGTLALQKIDLTQYFKAGTAPEPDAAKTGDKSVDLDFPLLHHLNIDLRLSTTELVVPPVTLGQSAISFSVKSGKLVADVALFDLCGGNGNGRLEFDATVPDSAIRVTAKMSEISAQSCIEIFAPDSPLEGTANLSADITSKGRTGKELLKSLAGKASVTVDEGQAGVDIAGLIASLKSGPILGWDTARAGDTSFQTLKGDFFFRQGGAYTDSLTIDLGKSSLTGEGTIDVARAALDMRMKLSERPLATQAEGDPKPDPAPVEEILIKGPWSHPGFSLEPAKSSAYFHLNRVTSRSALLGNN